MSFPISGGAPSGSGLDPASPHNTSDPSDSTDPGPSSHARSGPSAALVERSTLSPGAAALASSAGRSSGGSDLLRGEYYTGDMPMCTYLRTANAEQVRAQLDASLERLAHVLPGPGQQQSLTTATAQLRRDMERSDKINAEMMGHGKRWLERLIHQLESAAPVSSSDRAHLCGELTRALVTHSMPPGRAFGCALHALQARVPGGSAANGFRALLQERALTIWIAGQANMAQRVQNFGTDRMVAALLDGFGFSPDRARLNRPLPTVTAEELNQAAGAIENRLASLVLPVAHDILNRVGDVFEIAYRYPLGPSTPPSAAQQTALTQTLKFLQDAMGVDLMTTLRAFNTPSSSSWSLVDMAQLAQRIKELLPELSHAPSPPDREPGINPLADALVMLAPPSEGDGSTSSSANSSPEMELRSATRQDRGSGATGTFSAGTGGANRRGPT